MSTTRELIRRNAAFAADFDAADLPIIPRLRSVILTCADARVDPARIFGLELGDSAVIRNNGGRLTPSVLDEIVTLALVVARAGGGSPEPFNLVIVQHTKCGAERFVDPDLQAMLRARAGVDVTASAIHDHRECLRLDIGRLRDDPRVPGMVTVSALLYDVETGGVEQIVAPISVDALRASR